MGVMGETGREAEQRAVKNRADKTVDRFEAICKRLREGDRDEILGPLAGIATQLAAAAEIAEAIRERTLGELVKGGG